MTFDPKQPHNLELLPPDIDFNDPKFTKPLLKAHTALAELKGYSFGMPNPLLLLSPAILRESIASSEIEDIHTTIIDALQNQLLPESEQRKDDKEVLHYREAVLLGFAEMSKVSISTRLITGIHERLRTKENGYRKIQNAIAVNRTGEILYTPPIITEIPRLISNWENFVNAKDEIDPLIKVAISHYQFEAIHPFGDGNGRTGRILIVLQLIHSGLLHWPILYISGYINDNRPEYYKLLREISTKKNWTEFILFMIDGFYSQAIETKKTLFDILQLFNEMKTEIKTNHQKIYSADLIETLFAYPIISPVKLGKEMNVHYTTATRWLSELTEGGFLAHKKLGKYQLYINKKLIVLLSGNNK